MFVTGGCRGNCCRAIRLHVAEPLHDATDEVWCFCPVTLTCTAAPAMLKPRTMHTAVTCLDRVYVIGGRSKGTRGGAPTLLEVARVLLFTMCLMFLSKTAVIGEKNLGTQVVLGDASFY